MRRGYLCFQRLSLAGLLLCLAVLSGWAVHRVAASPSEAPVAAAQMPGTALMEVRGLSFSTYVEDRLASRIQTEQMLIKPRQFGSFRIKSVNEAVLVNARFEFHGSTEHGEIERVAEFSGDTLDFAQGIEGLAQLRGVGRLTRTIVSGMSLLYHQGEQPHLHMVARQAVMDLQGGETRLEEVVINCLTAQYRIYAQTAYWEHEAQRFFIPGEYRLSASGGKSSKGTGLAVDLNGRLYVLPRVLKESQS